MEASTRYLAILAALMGCQGPDTFRWVLAEALEQGLDPVLVMESRGIQLPLLGQATTTLDDRLEKGVEIQAVIFGEERREA